MKKIRIIGGGLAGCEAAYQLLKRGFEVDLLEMRPSKSSPAHKTNGLAELVCSNSLKSISEDSASGLLKAEMRMLDSLILKVAEITKVPAGGALSVDRSRFSEEIEKSLNAFSGFKRIDEEYTKIDDSIPTIIATGPLTSDLLLADLSKLTGDDNLFFYDAASPIVSQETIDMSKCFFAARYNKGTADYLNCPMNEDEYNIFYNELVNAKTVDLHNYENNVYENCMPIEVMAKRGKETMLYGPLRPVGLYDENNVRHYAVVQLRKENTSGEMYNLVGFQTNLLFGEQKRVFSLIPALKNAEFLRYGVMHKNSFINSPKILDAFGKVKMLNNIYIAGQLTGVEGYMESTASGLVSAINLARELNGLTREIMPKETILGGLFRHISNNYTTNYQPMNANFGILEPMGRVKDKKQKKHLYYLRGVEKMQEFIQEHNYNK